MQWRKVAPEVPRDEILIWSGGRRVVACYVEGKRPGEDPVFMDARTDDILPWPTFWMPLPPPPEE